MLLSKKGGKKMDPFTFGIVATGAFGGTLIVLGLLGKEYSINEDMIKLVMTIIQYGGILYLLKVLYTVFFF
jgi:hypothetical protein